MLFLIFYKIVNRTFTCGQNENRFLFVKNHIIILFFVKLKSISACQDDIHKQIGNLLKLNIKVTCNTDINKRVSEKTNQYFNL